MKQILVLLCVFLFCLQLPLKAKDDVKKEEVDSLRNLLSTTEDDSTRIRLLLKISSLHSGEPVEALNSCWIALTIAREKELFLHEGLIWENISLAYRDFGNYTEAIESSFNALRIYDELNLPKKTASLQLQIGSHVGAEKNYSKSILYISATQRYRQFGAGHDQFGRSLPIGWQR
jgi:tetratricopeptide (TPR) repeat protein